MFGFGIILLCVGFFSIGCCVGIKKTECVIIEKTYINHTDGLKYLESEEFIYPKEGDK